jgi:hypothetical protein
MSLCETSGRHRWNAQVALRKGGVEMGDPCDCGHVRFGSGVSELEELRDCILVLAAEYGKLVCIARAAVAWRDALDNDDPRVDALWDAVDALSEEQRTRLRGDPHAR